MSEESDNLPRPHAELEHGIMARYLFAAFSLQQSAAEGLTDAAAVQCRRRQFMHIAAREMLHLNAKGLAV